MSAPWLMIVASFLFATMGVCVKLASVHCSTGEMVFYRGLTGAGMVWLYARHTGGSLRTAVPGMHFWRCLTGVLSLCMWFYAIGCLPMATAMTLNYMSSVWMALFLVGGAVMLGAERIDWRLILSVLAGFGGVALILRPTIEHDQLWHGLIGLLSGMFAAMAYLQVTSLGRVGETDDRVVFYFSIAGMVVGTLLMAFTGIGLPSPTTLGLLLAIGVLSTVAQLMMTRAYRIGTVLVNASLQYLGIGFAFVYGVLLFDDRVSPYAIAGMVLIIGAGLSASLLRSEVARNNQHTSDA